MISILYNTVHGQVPEIGELGRFEYSLVPSIGEADLQSYSISISGRKKIRSGMLGIGLSYKGHNFSYYQNSIGFDESVFEKLHTLRTNVSYRYAINNKWAINLLVAPTLSSNFKNGIDNEDFLLNAFGVVSRRWKKEKGFSALNLGIGYGTLFGEPQFFPTLSFRHKVNKNWTYFLGIPETGVKYNFNECNSLRALATVSGLYANNSQATFFSGIGELTNTKLRSNSVDFGLEHNYNMQSGFVTVARIGLRATNSLEVLDRENNLLYDFAPNGSAYITMGLKYNLNIKMNENRKK